MAKGKLGKVSKGIKMLLRDCPQNLIFLLMFLLTASMIKKQSYFGWNSYYLPKKYNLHIIFWAKLKSLSIPNWKLNEAISRVVIK